MSLQDLEYCVPATHGDYLGDILAKYEHVIELNANNMLLNDLHPIEAWCNEYFGELEEHTEKSPWQLSFEQGIQNRRSFRKLYFHFHNDQFAMAFKLRWI